MILRMIGYFWSRKKLLHYFQLSITVLFSFQFFREYDQCGATQNENFIFFIYTVTHKILFLYDWLFFFHRSHFFSRDYYVDFHFIVMTITIFKYKVTGTHVQIVVDVIIAVHNFSTIKNENNNSSTGDNRIVVRRSDFSMRGRRYCFCNLVK